LTWLKIVFIRKGMITPAQSRAARGLLDWTQDELATAAGVGLSTVRDFESGRREPIRNNLAAMHRAFEAAGIEFLNGNAPGVRFRPTAKPSAPPKATPPKKFVRKPPGPIKMRTEIRP
jgi:transcriptional regulator with XRE-family HTH domain